MTACIYLVQHVCCRACHSTILLFAFLLGITADNFHRLIHPRSRFAQGVHSSYITGPNFDLAHVKVSVVDSCLTAALLYGFRVAGTLFTSGGLLFYTAMVVPVQIFLWDYSDPCNKFPTLYFDVLVDLFFMVRRSRR
jgi:hypothetical protein